MVSPHARIKELGIGGFLWRFFYQPFELFTSLGSNVGLGGKKHIKIKGKNSFINKIAYLSNKIAYLRNKFLPQEG
jgi:hypothetical protein